MLSCVDIYALLQFAILSGAAAYASQNLDVPRLQVALHHFEVWSKCCDCLSAHFDILSGREEAGLPTGPGLPGTRVAGPDVSSREALSIAR